MKVLFTFHLHTLIDTNNRSEYKLRTDIIQFVQILTGIFCKKKLTNMYLLRIIIQSQSTHIYAVLTPCSNKN
jgi:hypothetical protein